MKNLHFIACLLWCFSLWSNRGCYHSSSPPWAERSGSGERQHAVPLQAREAPHALRARIARYIYTRRGVRVHARQALNVCDRARKGSSGLRPQQLLPERRRGEEESERDSRLRTDGRGAPRRSARLCSWHAVAHLSGDQGHPSRALHLRHTPHSLCDPLVHLQGRGLRPRHLRIPLKRE